MTAKKTAGIKLDSLISKDVTLLAEDREYPVKILGIDQGFACVEFAGKQGWWSLSQILAIKETPNAEQ